MSKKILIIDDDTLVLQSLSRLLQKCGYETITAQDGYEALEKTDQHDIDLVICDIRMPGINGIETLSQIRKAFEQKSKMKSPELIITGYAEEELEVQAKNMEVSYFMYKPFDVNQFTHTIQKIFNDNTR